MEGINGIRGRKGTKEKEGNKWDRGRRRKGIKGKNNATLDTAVWAETPFWGRGGGGGNGRWRMEGEGVVIVGQYTDTHVCVYASE
jgi:hypothetical protein